MVICGADSFFGWGEIVGSEHVRQSEESFSFVVHSKNNK